jgi:hypothetical protein
VAARVKSTPLVKGYALEHAPLKAYYMRSCGALLTKAQKMGPLAGNISE